MNNKTLIFIGIIAAVAVAYLFFGWPALTGLLGLLGLAPDKKSEEAIKDQVRAEVHEELANQHREEADQAQKKATDVEAEQQAVIDNDTDDTTPINQVVNDAQRDWS